jgi:hypothetical protein
MHLKRSGDERRKHSRQRGLGATVSFRRLQSSPDGQPDPYHKGRLADITQGGMSFASDVELRCGEKIDYAILSPAGEKTSEGAARVAHSHADHGLYYVGVQFIG